MSETVANLAQKNARNALQRVEALEENQEQVGKTLTGVIKAVNDSLTNLNGGLDNLTKQAAAMAEVLDALVRVIGEENVETVVKEQRTIKAIANVQAMKDQVVKLVEAGTLSPAETVNENALVVFKEYTVDGVEIPNGRVQFTTSQIQPKFREQLLGKGAGTRVASPAGNSFEVMETYDIIEPPPAPPSEATVEAQATPAPPAPEVMASPAEA